MPAPEFHINVRDLVEFVHRRGDLAGEGQFRPARALEGARGHRRLQAARGEAYRAEVSVERIFERDGVILHLTGRVDGLLENAAPPIVEEIKTVDGKWSGQADPLHLAQARIYAAILAGAGGWEAVDVRLTYLDLETGLETDFRNVETRDGLGAFLEETVAAWLDWLIPHAQRLRERDASLAALEFPFANFRGGQRELARSVYRTIRGTGRSFIEAPTGLGKTLAVLFPAVKALPLLGEGRIFYVTAKTPGRLSAEDALDRLRGAGARLRSVSLTAKRKICFAENPSGCDMRTCPFAVGYYDRIKPALRELLQKERLDRPAIEAAARAHTVCPFELSLDASLWADVMVGDFNHVFDPDAQLQRHFAEGPARHAVLVDEAHNLVDRSRDMHSASLALSDLEVAAPRARGAAKARRALTAARDYLASFLASPQDPVLPPRPFHAGAIALGRIPRELLPPLKQAARALEALLADQRPGTDLSRWLEPWFLLRAFLKAADSFDETCRLILAPPEGRVTVFCADPSQRLREVLKGLRAAIFFSATLSPLEYFRDLLGGEAEDPYVSLPSPFRPEQMKLSVLGQDVTFKGRAASLGAVARAVAQQVTAAPGNHLVFCPSMDYLAALEKALAGLGLPVFSQTSLMDESQRETFLARFSSGARETGLAVLGGIFAEGIDLPGDRLVGVTVIGVGLPRLSLERDLLQDYFEKNRGQGFDYAYRFPGMQRVLQAVGRLIRAETDRGSALLIDARFLEKRYRLMFPEWWRISPKP